MGRFKNKLSNKEFGEIADLQRGEAEAVMVQAQHKLNPFKGGPLYGAILEAAGDLIHRSTEHGEGSYGAVKEKVDKLDKYINGNHMVDTDSQGNFTGVRWVDLEGKLDSGDLEGIKSMSQGLIQNYVAEHQALPGYNQYHQSLKDFTTAVGNMDWGTARSILADLKTLTDAGEEAWKSKALEKAGHLSKFALRQVRVKDLKKGDLVMVSKERPKGIGYYLPVRKDEQTPWIGFVTTVYDWGESVSIQAAAIEPPLSPNSYRLSEGDQTAIYRFDSHEEAKSLLGMVEKGVERQEGEQAYSRFSIPDPSQEGQKIREILPKHDFTRRLDSLEGEIKRIFSRMKEMGSENPPKRPRWTYDDPEEVKDAPGMGRGESDAYKRWKKDYDEWFALEDALYKAEQTLNQFKRAGRLKVGNEESADRFAWESPEEGNRLDVVKLDHPIGKIWALWVTFADGGRRELAAIPAVGKSFNESKISVVVEKAKSFYGKTWRQVDVVAEKARMRDAGNTFNTILNPATIKEDIEGLLGEGTAGFEKYKSDWDDDLAVYYIVAMDEVGLAKELGVEVSSEDFADWQDELDDRANRTTEGLPGKWGLPGQLSFGYHDADGSYNLIYTWDKNDIVEYEARGGVTVPKTVEDVPTVNPKAEIDRLLEEYSSADDARKRDIEQKIEKFKKVGKIVKRKGGYHVVSEKGKNLGGPYKSRGQAEKRLKQVEYFKHKQAGEWGTATEKYINEVINKDPNLKEQLDNLKTLKNNFDEAQKVFNEAYNVAHPYVQNAIAYAAKRVEAVAREIYARRRKYPLGSLERARADLFLKPLGFRTRFSLKLGINLGEMDAKQMADYLKSPAGKTMVDEVSKRDIVVQYVSQNAKRVAKGYEETVGKDKIWYVPWPPKSEDSEMYGETPEALVEKLFPLWNFKGASAYSDNPENFERLLEQQGLPSGQSLASDPPAKEEAKQERKEGEEFWENVQRARPRFNDPFVNGPDYQHIRAKGFVDGDNAATTLYKLEEARFDKAPENAVFKDNGGKWVTFDEIEDKDFRIQIANAMSENPYDANRPSDIAAVMAEVKPVAQGDVENDRQTVLIDVPAYQKVWADPEWGYSDIWKGRLGGKRWLVNQALGFIWEEGNPKNRFRVEPEEDEGDAEWRNSMWYAPNLSEDEYEFVEAALRDIRGW